MLGVIASGKGLEGGCGWGLADVSFGLGVVDDGSGRYFVSGVGRSFGCGPLVASVCRGDEVGFSFVVCCLGGVGCWGWVC